MPGGGFWGAYGYPFTGPAAKASGSLGGNRSKLTPGSATGGSMPGYLGGGNRFAGAAGANSGGGPGQGGMVRQPPVPGRVGSPGQQTQPPGGPQPPFPQIGPAPYKSGASMPGKAGMVGQDVSQKWAGTFQRNPFLQARRQGWAAAHPQGGPQYNYSADPNMQTVPGQTRPTGGADLFNYYNNLLAGGGQLGPEEIAEFNRLRMYYGQSQGNAGTGGGAA